MSEIKDVPSTDQTKPHGKEAKAKKPNDKEPKEKVDYTAVKEFKQKLKEQKKQTKLYSKRILKGEIISTTNSKPDTSKYVIELVNVKKSYITGEVETPVLKGINLKLEKGDFIVILGPSGSGKTTLLNIISGLDKVSSGDVFVIGYNLSLLKDVDLTKFRRDNVGFIFQQYNLLTNLTAKENAEVGENLSKNKNKNMTIKDIFETIGMEEQMNKYPHQMSGGQQQRVSIARALAKNPDILFGDEPTGALDEEMGRKVLEILVDVNKKYKTTVIIVTHNPNIADIANTVIHVRNGLIDQIKKNTHLKKPSEIDWS
ncbi:MAG: ABC transporter ATP-binding protein [Spiroplasma sp. hy2]|uniref:ABC transporter ATP-binding protein n=1 Tax=Spiroplasma sp. hy2 TaxID=2490850 RepID=UPI003B6B9F0F